MVEGFKCSVVFINNVGVIALSFLFFHILLMESFVDVWTISSY